MTHYLLKQNAESFA